MIVSVIIMLFIIGSVISACYHRVGYSASYSIGDHSTGYYHNATITVSVIIVLIFTVSVIKLLVFRVPQKLKSQYPFFAAASVTGR